MAEIVRKIGKLTRYETKSYVGDQRILDLDRASGDDPDDADRSERMKPANDQERGRAPRALQRDAAGAAARRSRADDRRYACALPSPNERARRRARAQPRSWRSTCTPTRSCMRTSSASRSCSRSACSACACSTREGGELSMVYATGRLRPERRDRIELTREALARHGVAAAATSLTAASSRSTRYRPFFVNGALGFDVPMMDGEQLAGVLSVEYPRRRSRRPTTTAPLIVQLALQLGSALRNCRLHRESVYLRDYLSKLLDHANAPIMVIGRDGEVTLRATARS